MSNEEINDVIKMLLKLDMYFEDNLEEDNIQKTCVSIKLKELIFWLTWYKDDIGDEEDE